MIKMRDITKIGKYQIRENFTNKYYIYDTVDKKYISIWFDKLSEAMSTCLKFMTKKEIN